MIVMKFGGTSVGTPASFRQATGLVADRVHGDPVVVVSALSGITNLLVELCHGRQRSQAATTRLVSRHERLAGAVGLDPRCLDETVEAWRRVVGGLPAKGVIAGEQRDLVLSFGERLSAALFAEGLRSAGVAAAAVTAGDAGLVTDDRFGAAHPLPESAEALRRSLARRPPVPVITGFLGRTRDGRITTLGRGGSDYSAALLGAALDADEIQIWTDTSGMLSADPRVVPDARPVPRLSFAEASELAYFGAKVLHPKTLLPAVEKRIPVRILNTTRPGDPGSLITSEPERTASRWRVRSIASKRGITAVTVVSSRMLLAYGFLARVFEVFGRHHIVIDLVTTSEVSISVTVDDASRLGDAMEELEAIGRVEVRRGLAVVAVVGEGAPQQVGLAAHVFTLIAGVGVPVEMISQGASRVNLSLVVPDEEADRVVRLLHQGLGLDAGAPEEAFSAGATQESRA